MLELVFLFSLPCVGFLVLPMYRTWKNWQQRVPMLAAFMQRGVDQVTFQIQCSKKQLLIWERAGVIARLERIWGSNPQGSYVRYEPVDGVRGDLFVRLSFYNGKHGDRIENEVRAIIRQDTGYVLSVNTDLQIGNGYGFDPSPFPDSVA